MQINKHYEPEIRLKDVFFEILYRWRSILVAAIIGALLLGGYQYYSVWSVHKEGLKTDEEQKYELALNTYQMTLKTTQERLRVTRTLLQQLEDYTSKSVLYNMDASSMIRVDRSYLVTMKQAADNQTGLSFQDPADYVMASYASALFDGLDPDQMMAMLGTSEKRYINELVRLGFNTDTNMMTLAAYGVSEEKANEVADFFADRMMTVCAAPIQALYPHDLTLVSRTVSIGPSDSIQESWSESAANMASYQTSISKGEETLFELQQQGEPGMPGMHLGRMAAIGFVLFAFLMVAIYAIKYLANGRLHDSREMVNRYGLFVFAEADHSRARRPGKGIDALIEKWEFGKSRINASQACQQAASLLASKVTGNTLVLVSTRPSENSVKPMQKALENVLGSKAGKIVHMGDFLSNEDAARLANGADLLIVEEKYESSTDRMRREAEILSLQSVNVLGSVVL